MSLKIDLEECVRCGTCSGVCPQNAIILTEFEVLVTEKCNDCGICEKVCPLGAIEVP
ncbi:ferredoxin [Thermococci archaeon]|nr:MAG: ferredoxin [Thermococci archaeon]